MLAAHKNHRPNLRSGELYALQQIEGEEKYVADIYATLPEDQYSRDPRKARRFSGRYLNDCSWSSWSLDYAAVPVKELDRRIEKFRASKPTGPKRTEPEKQQTKNTKK